MWVGDLSFRKCRNKHMCRIVSWSLKVSVLDLFTSLSQQIRMVGSMTSWAVSPTQSTSWSHIIHFSRQFCEFSPCVVSPHINYLQSKTWNISNQNTTTNIYNYQHETPLLSYHCRDFHRCQYWYRVCCCKYRWLYWPVAHMMCTLSVFSIAHLTL